MDGGYEQKCRGVAELIDMNKTKDEKITELIDMNKTKDEKITWLEEKVRLLEEQAGDKQEEEVPTDAGMKKSTRSYNVRKYKNHPQSQRASKAEYQPYLNEDTSDFHAANTVEKTAGILFCPIHGTRPFRQIPPTVTQDRPKTSLPEADGRRRHGPYCGAIARSAAHSTPQQRKASCTEGYRIYAHAQVATMRNLVMSFETIQKIFLMIYGRFIHVSTLEDVQCSI